MTKRQGKSGTIDIKAVLAEDEEFFAGAGADGAASRTLAGFGPEGTPLVQWERAVDRANDTFYKSRDRLVEAGKVRYDPENARYIVVGASVGPDPEMVQNGSKSTEVQEASPVSPL